MASASVVDSQLNEVATKVKQYHFPVESIPRLSYDDPEAERLIRNEEPVILTGTNLVASALQWSPEYLSNNIGHGTYTVYSSKNHKFLYYDDKKICKVPTFTPPTTHQDMTFQDFLNKVTEWKEGEPYNYLQQSLNDSVGPQIVQDFAAFNWKWISDERAKNNWGALTSNLLLVGMDGVVTPVHYDEQQNFFAQVHGFKRFLLFDPSMFGCLYPYPVFHPHDRQSQVDFDNPDFDRFPRLRELKGRQAILGPGDVLYLPVYWWHQVESVPGYGMTVSVNFWYKSGPTEKIVYPLKPHQKVAMMRNIEKMITEALNNPEEVPPLLQDMVLGRYT
ncbi:hypoxia-inducible factor 1-alpha inhibitor-like [Littorina saxatilis]|uniref:JmjC domain-containing protein n=1 Tax=Littorina saxatilis TaxID=31220 RepID=A0AAN9C142_9CAEN